MADAVKNNDVGDAVKAEADEVKHNAAIADIVKDTAVTGDAAVNEVSVVDAVKNETQNSQKTELSGDVIKSSEENNKVENKAALENNKEENEAALENCDLFGNKAPSCALLFGDEYDGDILVHEICVPKIGSAKFTNYCCLQWNGGRNGQGCCGFLDHPEGKCLFFSLFQPMSCKEPIIATYKGTGTFTEVFGDARKGLKSMNFQVGWKPDRWYTIVIRTWDVDGNSTHFGCWVEDQSRRIWTHVITMKFPVPGIHFKSSTSCFLEDWHGNGKAVRCVWFKNGFKRLLDKQWSPFSLATFIINQSEASKNYNRNYDAGSNDNVFYMQTGSTTVPAADIQCGTQLTRLPVPQPHRLLISFKITKVTGDRIEWDVATSTPPQFHYAVVGSNCNQSEARGSALWSPKADITLTLEDIFGRSVSKTVKIE